MKTILSAAPRVLPRRVKQLMPMATAWLPSIANENGNGSLDLRQAPGKQ